MSPVLGAVADDLTGATDLAITLVEAGFRTTVVVGDREPEAPAGSTGVRVTGRGTDAVVVALTTRSDPPETAVRRTLEALDRLRAIGCERFYVKYCSTFDSTPLGNIGPVLDAVLEELGEPATVVAPSFPANGRTVYQGHLFVGDRLLSESSMRDHPITPMRDADVRRLLAAQSRSVTGLVPLQVVRRGPAAVRSAFDELVGGGVRLVVVDAVDDADLVTVARATAHVRLLSGGSALAQGLVGPRDTGASEVDVPDGRRIVLSGSASVATRGQVAHALEHGAGTRLRAAALREAFGATVDETVRAALDAPREPFVVYATATPEDVVPGDAALLERAFGAIAQGLVAAGVRALVVAGGETSGAVTAALGVRHLDVGPVLDPGVAWVRAVRHDGDDVALVLKSGNFGGRDLFCRAWDVGRPTETTTDAAPS
ncbi:3-oxo-tetronate kinase [Oerskovia sp. KBS0722]|uniref:3-oxo-tetronate kinase n=1 Tax=Oerskovia sp. KBS0722 TaxID=1179673 RepID=UPI001AEF376E|nr:3-oxo-tetronate kinase [Oerskovia sp. KBS0722]